MKADSIGSRGRVGFTDATSLGSVGRIITGVAEVVIEVVVTELIRGVSAITQIWNLESEV